jgi:triosephosphate isomerase
LRTPLVAGNWKMHGDQARLTELGRRIAGAEVTTAEVLVCPPFVYLQALGDVLQGSNVQLGAQDVADQGEDGAFTGEVSAAMVADMNCGFALVGHSERRALYGDTNARVAVKFQMAQAGGLCPVLCVGETLEEREQGATASIVGAQLDAVIEAAGIAAFANAVVAYEPVWAIGTGRTATPEQAQQIHADIRTRIAKQDATIAAEIRILYGGSVKGANARDLFSMQDIDGGLVGGASLKADEFIEICEAAGQIGRLS